MLREESVKTGSCYCGKVEHGRVWYADTDNENKQEAITTNEEHGMYTK